MTGRESAHLAAWGACSVPWLPSWAQLGMGLVEAIGPRGKLSLGTWPDAGYTAPHLASSPAHSSPPSVTLELKWQVFHSKQSVLLRPGPWPVPSCMGGDRRLRNRGLFFSQPHSRTSLGMQVQKAPLLSSLEKPRLTLLLLEGQHCSELGCTHHLGFWWHRVTRWRNGATTVNWWARYTRNVGHHGHRSGQLNQEKETW